MSSSSTTIQSTSRIPIGFVVINGISVLWKSFQITNARYTSASTFNVIIPSQSLPKNLTLDNIITNSPIVVAIYAGFLTSVSQYSSATYGSFPLLIEGNADDINYDARDGLITIKGRDYVALFMETQVQPNPYSATQQTNLSAIFDTGNTITSDQVITQIAQSYNLNTDNVIPTVAPVGKYLLNSNPLYGQLSQNITEWDLMCYLAKEEYYDLFIVGKNIFFQPRNQTAQPYVVTLTIPNYTSTNPIPSSNAIDVSFSRNMRIAKDINVTVNSIDYRNKNTYSATASLEHTSAISGSNVPANYNYNIPNLTQAQCLLKAQALLLAISQHEMNLTVKIPANQSINIITVLSVSGTNTLFDQNYYIKSINSEMEFSGAYLMTIEASNQSPYVINQTQGQF